MSVFKDLYRYTSFYNYYIQHLVNVFDNNHFRIIHFRILPWINPYGCIEIDYIQRFVVVLAKSHSRMHAYIFYMTSGEIHRSSLGMASLGRYCSKWCWEL